MPTQAPSELPSELPSALTLKPGQTARLRLGGAGPAGYSWSWTLTGDSACITVTLQSAPESAVPRSKPGAEPQTYTRDHILTILANHPGRTTLTLRLARSFQLNRPPLTTHILTITVTKE
jgi:hypothetical protein